jgi:hypothetical protein
MSEKIYACDGEYVGMAPPTEEEVEELRRDAERYRWLRDNPWTPEVRAAEMFLCEWKLSEADSMAAELAQRYHRLTEAYDRTVCTGPIRDGSIMPMGAHEMALVNRIAITVRKQIMVEAAAAGISAADMRRAISRAA